MKFLKTSFFKLSLYALIFGLFLAFGKIIFQTYNNFFNETGENKIIKPLEEIKKTNFSTSGCTLEVLLPKNFEGEHIIKFIINNPECENEILPHISSIFLNKKAVNKFLKLSEKNTQSQEVEKNGSTASFKIQTIFVTIKRWEYTLIELKNLNRK